MSGTSSISPAGTAAGGWGCGRPLRRALDVLRDDPPLGAGCRRATARSMPQLARDAARERRCLDAAAGRGGAAAGLRVADRICGRLHGRLSARSSLAAGAADPSAGSSATLSPRPSGRSSSRAGAAEPPRRLATVVDAPSTADTSSPCSPITATVRPTSTSPSWTAILSRTPEASASTSWVTFSVSSS